MFGAIKHGLGNVANFHGRDARQTFWYYVLFLVVLRVIAGLATSIPTMIRAVGIGMSAAQNQADPQEMQRQMMAAMIETLPFTMWLGVVIGLVTLALLAASLARRLHDSGMSGWWTILPGALYLGALARLPVELDRARGLLSQMGERTMVDPAALAQGQGWSIVLGWAPLLMMIVIGVRKSNEGPNRFGDAPVRF